MEILYLPNYFNCQERERLFAALRSQVAWRTDDVVRIGAIVHPLPRWQAAYATEPLVYAYSGMVLEAASWIAPLATLIDRIRARFPEADPNFALINLYRHGRDSVAAHADDEPELGRNPSIFSASLGATRRFILMHKTDKSRRHVLDLEAGSLLVMRGPTQHHWLHAVPKTRRDVGERINVTFRRMLRSSSAPCSSIGPGKARTPNPFGSAHGQEASPSTLDST